MICVYIFRTIPVLYDPILESILCFTFCCYRSSCSRACNGLCLIRIEVRIIGCIGTIHNITIIIFACRCINDLDTISTVKNLSPGSIKINLAHRSGIIRIISAI